jgi:lipoyl(octanoyl) transferase
MTKQTTATTWRLIDSGPLDGPSNMALDEALLSCFDARCSAPVLRLYGWQPSAFSLGRFQQAAAVLDTRRCNAANVAVVRRITGGGCIFHAEELTYSIICSPEHLSGITGVKESYRRLCGFLLLTYQQLGLAPAYAIDAPQRPARLGERTPLCFAGTEEYDILCAGHKLGGNAQRRCRGLIFQHGSIPLEPTHSQAEPYLRCAEPALTQRATSLAEAGCPITAEALKSALITAFASNLDISLHATPFTDQEQERAAQLRENKYQTTAWNLQGVTP